jgi:hypothetical protein
MLPDENTQDYAEEVETLRHVEQVVHPHGPALLDLYFHIVHPSFPIIQKHLFVERYRNGDRTFSPSLMAGMYILALNWWSFDPKLAQYSKPDAARLEAIAMKSLSRAMERPKLSTIQAGLLLLQRPEADSWSLTTQLVAIGQELGLHLDCSSWSIPLWERGLRKRIAWALYMQDKWSSLIHGRPSHIFGANWAVKPITDEDFKEDGDGYEKRQDETEDEREENERGQVLFAQMIGLTMIMAEVMDTFYTQTAIQDFANAGKNSTALILARAKNVQLKLRKWHEELPKSVKMSSNTGGKLSSTGMSVTLRDRSILTFFQAICISRTSQQKSPSTAASCSPSIQQRTTPTASSCAAAPPKRASSPPWTLSTASNQNTCKRSGTLPPKSTSPSSAPLARCSGPRRLRRKKPSFTRCVSGSIDGRSALAANVRSFWITPCRCWMRVVRC